MRKRWGVRCGRITRYRITRYLQSMALQGYNPLTALETALNGNAATMIEKLPRQNNPANQDKGSE